jgi:putative ABC transport system permease protein
MDMSLAGTRSTKTVTVAQIAQESRQRLTNLPGVQAAAASCRLPFVRVYDLPFDIEGRLLNNAACTGFGAWRSVSPGYFDLFQIPLMRRRAFTDGDVGGTEPVVVINETMAKQFWPKGDELGVHITIGKGVGPEFVEPPREIIGVVGDVRDTELSNQPVPMMYVPVAQMTDGMTAANNNVAPMVWLIRPREKSKCLDTKIGPELLIAGGGLPVVASD